MSSSTALLTSLERDGYVIIRAIVSPLDLSVLQKAAKRSTDLARAGKWAYTRTLPRQFPPWPTSTGSKPAAADGIWGVQGLLKRELPGHEAFTRSYFSTAILDVAKELLRCGDDDLVMELFNLLVRPDADFALRWHRDDIAASATADEETARLAEPAWHAQWNLALYDDCSLIVLPGSHARPRTGRELAVGEYADMPGQLKVELKAGDAVFYNNNILHRGLYDSRTDRATLHGSVGHVRGSELRARNVLQHGIGQWVQDCDFSCLGSEGTWERERAEGMRRRLVEMGRIRGEVGYSLED